MDNTVKKKERDFSLDLIRLIAIIGVVAIHVSNYYCRNIFEYRSSGYAWALFYNTISRVSVPLFFMISGALMLNRDVSVKKLRNRILHFIMILVVWTIIYWFTDYFMMGYRFTVNEYFNIIFEPIKAPLWFMYAIIGLYLALPFTRILIKNMTEKMENYFMIMWLIFFGGKQVLVPVLDHFDITVALKYPIPIMQGTYYLGYFMIGAILYKRARNHSLKIKRPLLYILPVICMAISFGISWWWSIDGNEFYSKFLVYSSVLMMVSSISVFVLLLDFQAKSNFGKKLLGTLSPLLFGVYLIHCIFLNLAMKFMDILGCFSLWMVPVLTVAIFVVSALVVFILEKIPGVRQLVI